MNFILKLGIGLLISVFFVRILRFFLNNGISRKSPIIYVIAFTAILITSVIINYMNNTNISLFSLMSKVLEDMIAYTLIFVILLYLDKRKNNN